MDTLEINAALEDAQDWQSLGPATGSYVLTWGCKFGGRTNDAHGLSRFEHTWMGNKEAQIWQEHRNGAVRIY